MINFYHRFVHNLAHILTPLHLHITKLQSNPKHKSAQSFFWTEDCEKAFDAAKNALTTATLLFHPKENVPISIATDASDKAMGGVLQQWVNEHWQPLGFFSKKLSLAQSKYSAFDRELLAIHDAIRHFQYFVEGRDFCIFTDHKPLINALSSKTEKNPRQARHLDFISQFTSDIRYIKGKDNLVPDALSRFETDSINLMQHDMNAIAEEQIKDQSLKDIITNQHSSSSYRLGQVPLSDSLTIWSDFSEYSEHT